VALSDKDKFVRMECARALGNIGPPARSAVTALTSASRDSELLVARQAQEALKKLGPE
jgi:HEAT repeat protein